MASKPEPQAEAAAEVEPTASEPEQSQEAAPEVAAEPQAEVAAEPEAAPEPVADVAADPEANEIAEINAAALVPMKHPDGNHACDAYKLDKAGNILVPVADAELMKSHGFVVAAE